MPTTVLSDTDQSWWKIGKESWKVVLKSTGKQFAADGVAILSASVTLRIVLSLVPALIAAIAIAAQVISVSDIEDLVESANTLVPGQDAQDFVTGTVEDAVASLREEGLGALIGSIAVGIFAASSAAVALIKALNIAYGVEENRGFLGQRTASLAVIGALVLALVGMFVAIVLGPSLLELVLPASVLDSPLNILITLGRFVGAVLILMLFFGFAFWFGPSRERPKLRFLTPGAVIGVVGWLLLSYLFSIYVRVAGSYNATYGAVAGIVVLLVWLNYSFIVLLMGAELDSELEKFTALREAQGALEAARGVDAEPVGALPAGALPAGERVSDADSDGVAPPTTTRAPGRGAAQTADERPSDLDAVTADMPRHPGLLAAAVDAGTTDSSGSADASSTGASDRTTPAKPHPSVLMGAARKTSGAWVAAALWARMRD